MTLVRGSSENAEVGQEKHQENVGEERLFNKMFECSSKSSENPIIPGQGLSEGCIRKNGAGFDYYLLQQTYLLVKVNLLIPWFICSNIC